jgi:hypothetical protein
MGYMGEENSDSQVRNQKRKRQIVTPPRFVLPGHSVGIAKGASAGPSPLKLPSKHMPAIRKLPPEPSPEPQDASVGPPLLKLPSKHMPAIQKLPPEPSPEPQDTSPLTLLSKHMPTSEGSTMPMALPAHFQKRSAAGNLQLVGKEGQWPAQSSAPAQSDASVTEAKARRQ